MKPGRPRDPESNMSRMRAFFETNPTEELTFADVATKLDISQEQAVTLVRMLRNDGVCETAYVIRKKSAA